MGLRSPSLCAALVLLAAACTAGRGAGSVEEGSPSGRGAPAEAPETTKPTAPTDAAEPTEPTPEPVLVAPGSLGHWHGDDGEESA